MSAASSAIEGATEPLKKILTKKGAPNKLAYGLGLLVLFLVVIRFRTEIVNLLGKLPVVGPMLTKIAGG